MPFRSMETLQSWVDEFRLLGYEHAEELRVIPQDGASGANTGLIALNFRFASTTAFIQPIVQGDPRWVITFEAREEALELDAAGVTGLAGELAVVSALVAFLQAKASSFMAVELERTRAS